VISAPRKTKESDNIKKEKEEETLLAPSPLLPQPLLLRPQLRLLPARRSSARNFPGNSLFSIN